MKLLKSIPKLRFEPSEDSSQQRRDTTVHEIGSRSLPGGVLVTGTVGDDGKLTDGITFTAGQTRDIPHSLGRVPTGFIVTDATGSAPLLYRTKFQPDGLDTTLIRLTHTGASSTTVKILVL